MAVTLVVEDGSGKVDANSYVTTAEADAYWLNRADVIWEALDDEDKKAALVIATQHLESAYEWATGIKGTKDQALGWPRLGAEDDEGYSIDSDVVPQQVKDACFELAYRSAAGTTLMPDETGPRVVSESVEGAVAVTYDPNSTTQTTFSLIEGILSGLVYSDSGIMGENVRA